VAKLAEKDESEEEVEDELEEIVSETGPTMDDNDE
jgi:hypothetical protein